MSAERFPEFERRYRAELAATARTSTSSGRARDGALTRVYAASDEEHNDAVVLAELLREHR